MTRLPFQFRPELTRRAVLLGASASAVTLIGGRAAQALSTGQATALVERAVAEINRAAASGKSGSSLYRAFSGIFARYADVGVIARSVLGTDWRSASNAQRRAFTAALQGYLARKYGRQFRGPAVIRIKGAAPVNRYVEVSATSQGSGRGPLDVTFLVSDRGGSARFFDIRLQGVSLIRTERGEIGAMLDRRRGNIDLLIQDLNNS